MYQLLKDIIGWENLKLPHEINAWKRGFIFKETSLFNGLFHLSVRPGTNISTACKGYQWCWRGSLAEAKMLPDMEVHANLDCGQPWF